MQFASLALCAMLVNGAMAQQRDSATPPPVATVSPADPAAATTAMAQPPYTMTKNELKRQRKQQKLDESAANATSKAARAHAAVDKANAKSKQANDRQLQAQEKAGQVTSVQPTTVPEPAAPVPETTRLPQ
ncbi:MAG TPA: hypothetical protein VGU25_08975 [Acidobacteriaceae bacterium]|nr:hypothetical protein [Acidobacteriaceae bacterium]